MRYLLLPLTLLLLSAMGCTSVPAIVKQLKDDKAVVTLQVRSIYANVYFTRDGRPDNGTEVTPEGGVKSIQPASKAK